ncbi:MAG: Ppx/GppA phosphatase family protein [Lentisphaeria bacterium]|nr:Ppx/GppA phosphatase family protein [Lentisphaeria bacterium]
MTMCHTKPAPAHFACLDIGTNSVLLLMAAVDEAGTITEEGEGYQTTRLGQGVDQTGRLRPEAVARTLEAVEMFMSQAMAYPGRPLRLAVVSTSAARDAVNGNDFTAPCRRICGCEPTILTGGDEALATYIGAAGDLPDSQPAVTLDIGGGSTEVAFGAGSTCLFRTSLNMGCVRFGERFSLFDLPSPEAIQAARQAVRDELATPVKEIGAAIHPADTGNIHYLASGGTATSFASLAQSLPTYDKTRAHGFHAETARARAMTARLLAMPLADRARLPGLRKGRGKVLSTGMLILQECLEALAAPSFHVSARGLRFGIIRQMAEGRFTPSLVIQ